MVWLVMQVEGSVRNVKDGALRLAAPPSAAGSSLGSVS